MTEISNSYTEFHPRWYRKHTSTYWWMGSWRYVLFISRELSSVAVAWSVWMTLFLLRALLNGPDAYAFTFASVGTYSYHCVHHPTMVGTITVTP